MTGRRCAAIVGALLLGACAEFDATGYVERVGANWCRQASNCDVYSPETPAGPLTAYDRGLHQSTVLVPGLTAADPQPIAD